MHIGDWGGCNVVVSCEGQDSTSCIRRAIALKLGLHGAVCRVGRIDKAVERDVPTRFQKRHYLHLPVHHMKGIFHYHKAYNHCLPIRPVH